jgi:hypothetical protein
MSDMGLIYPESNMVHALIKQCGLGLIRRHRSMLLYVCILLLYYDYVHRAYVFGCNDLIG